MALVHDVEVIEDPAAAAVALDPVRARLLAELAEPASAATLAARLGIPRQKVNYHLKTLESTASSSSPASAARRHHRAGAAGHGRELRRLARRARRRRRRSRAAPDHLSARYLVALGGRVVREVGALAPRADAAGKRLPTMAIDTEIRFRSAADRAAFADELTAAVSTLAARYHHDDGRPHRLVVAAHPNDEFRRPHGPLSDDPRSSHDNPRRPPSHGVRRSRSPVRPSRSGTRSPPPTASARGSCPPSSTSASAAPIVSHMGEDSSPAPSRLGPAAPLRLRGARLGVARRPRRRGRSRRSSPSSSSRPAPAARASCAS